MNKLSVMTIATSIDSLHGVACRCEAAEDEHGKGSPADSHTLNSVLHTLKQVRDIGMNESAYGPRVADFDCRGQALVSENYIKMDPNVTTIKSELRTITNTIFKDVDKFAYLLVREDRRNYIDVDGFDVDSAKVSVAFPSARQDIREAGNCLAAECHTAAVFHLMRVAEYGLRALAYDRRVKIPKGKPIELATWDTIIKKLEDAEDAIITCPQTLAREAQFDFYHGAMMEFKRFKNKFRNKVMHTRHSYDSHQAMSAFAHVGEFMRILATRISEKKRTPVIWRGTAWTR